MPVKQVFDKNMVEILPGQKVRARWDYHYINTREDEGIVDRLDEYGGVTIRTDHPIPHYDRQGFQVHSEPWFYFSARYDYEKHAYVASYTIGDTYEHGGIPVWIEVLEQPGKKEKKGSKSMGAKQEKAMAKKPAISGYFNYHAYLKSLEDRMGRDSEVPDMFGEAFRVNRERAIREILGQELLTALESGKAVLAVTDEQAEEIDSFGNWVYNKMLDYGTDEDYAALRRDTTKFIEKTKPKGKMVIMVLPSDEYMVEK